MTAPAEVASAEVLLGQPASAEVVSAGVVAAGVASAGVGSARVGSAGVASAGVAVGRGLSEAWLANLARLQSLGDLLASRGLTARLMTPPGRLPSLHVVNPAAAALAEDVYAGRGQDGRWWFWWSWAERIAASDDLDGAAAMIQRVLAAS